MDYLNLTTLLKSLAAVPGLRKPTYIFRIASFEIKTLLTSWYRSSCASIEEYPIENYQPSREYPDFTEQSVHCVRMANCMKHWTYGHK